jgi:thioredoxin
MKRIFIMALALMAMTACVSKVKKPVKKEKVVTVAATGRPTEMTKAMFVEKIADMDAAQTEFKYKGDKPAIIDFYATWCGPCKMVAPIMAEIAKEKAGKIDVYKVDIDKEKELADAFGIQSIPTVLFIPMKGKPIMTQGAMPKSEFEKVIKQIEN